MSKLIIVAALREELADTHIPHNIPVVYTGVGKLNAALAVHEALGRYQPELVVNFGTAGRVAATNSELVEIADVIQRDMDAQPLAQRGVTPYGHSPFALDSGFAGVRCATGDSFVRAADPWLLEQGVAVVDMELFALALVCQRQNTQWRSFKYITDDGDDSAGQDWLARVDRGRDLFLAKLAQLI